MSATIHQYNYRYLHGYISVAIFPEIHVFQSLIDFPSGKFGLAQLERPSASRQARRREAAGRGADQATGVSKSRPLAKPNKPA
jgi:hypothetical protein